MKEESQETDLGLHLPVCFSALTNWPHSDCLRGLLPGVEMPDLLPPSTRSCSALRLERQTSPPMDRGCLHLTTPYSGEFYVYCAPTSYGIHVPLIFLRHISCASAERQGLLFTT